jgi:hypothetical protein
MLKEYQLQINHSQGWIMFALWMDDGISISELVRRTPLEKSTLLNTYFGPNAYREGERRHNPSYEIWNDL